MSAGNAVFICHSSRNATLAREVMEWLEAHGVACWISSRDIDPGSNYQESIVRAIRAARMVVFLFSDESNRSREVMKELSLASSFGHPVLPLRVTRDPPNEALLYELSTSQWVDGWPDLHVALTRLLQAIGDAKAPAAAAPLPNRPAKPTLTLTEPQAEALRLLLARQLGPIARVLLQRTLRESGTIAELCDNLATHLPDAAKRVGFVREAQASLKGG